MERLFESAMARLVAGGALLQLPATVGCVEDPHLASVEQADWAQWEGQRNTEMVSYTGGYWSQCVNPNTRFGCGSIQINVQVRVKPVAGADLAWKRVGVVYKTPSDSTERTALGNYVQTWGNGDEEWIVPVTVSTSQTTILFNAWYQDGAGHTFYDDNHGELHVINDGPAYQVVRVEPWENTVVVDEQGVHGTISLQVADLDYDKQIEIVATTDNWNTVVTFGIGSPGDVNRWYWSEDLYGGRERWTIDVDLPGATDAFEYAVVYRHGVVNNARVYEFWDNNGGSNYRVVPTQPVE